MEKEIKQTWHFNHSPQEVWEYLTKPELLEQWLGKTNFQPVVGHKFRFASPYGNDSFCEVLEVKPYTLLSFTWQKKSLKDQQPFNSRITWTLVPTESGTDLHLLHNGFVAMDDFSGHENGWKACVKKFEELINTIKK